MRGLVHAARREEDGSTVAEAAIVVPVAMVAILFVVQACLWAHADALVKSAAAQGQQAAADVGSPAIGVQQARAFLASSGASVITGVDVSGRVVGTDDVEISVSGSAESVLPWFHVTLGATRRGPIQEFRRGE